MNAGSILIKNGIIVKYSTCQPIDILIQNGKIETITTSIKNQNEVEQIIDASGLYILPGGIDPHVHLHLPTPAGYSSDDFYTGTRAALAGGTTSVIDFVTPKRGQSLVDALLLRRAEAKNAQCPVKFHVSPVEWLESTEHEMEICVKEYGVTSFKTYLAYRKTIGIDFEVLEKVMQTAKKLGALVTVHAELGDAIDENIKQLIALGRVTPKDHAASRPPETEYKAVEQVIRLVEKTGCPLYFVHLSARQSVDLVRGAKKRGLPVYAETCPHYLVLDETVYEGDFFQSAPYVISPPVRAKEHQQALWEAVADGTIDTIGTDHCPFNLNGQKTCGYNDFTKIPNGAGGIEYRLPLIYSYGVKSGKISISKMVDLLSNKPAELFKIENQGKIDVGYQANIVLLKPDEIKTITREDQFQQCDSNIYEGIPVIGSIHTVILSGKKTIL